jgi:catechol 2,3-dioxygenase-like lactoylglutathione lyase family enzyme
MSSLKEVIVFTPDLGSMRSFYEDGLGLKPARAGSSGAWFDTAGATLTLQPLAGGREREIELSFGTPELESEMERLRARGVESIEIRPGTSGKRVQFRDSEGNRLSLVEGHDTPGGSELAIAQVVINCADLARALAFYRDRLGLKVAVESTHWVELDTGSTRLALHTRPAGLNHPLHAGQRVAYCLEAPDLDAWVEEMRERGLHFATAPIEEEFGLYAEAIDPDGNVVVFRAPREEPSLEEELAEAFESDDVPHVVAIRKPVLKGAKATSRVALKPEHEEPKAARLAGNDREPREVSTARGSGPERTRIRPHNTSDTKRARAKPAIGRLRKAERKSLTSQKRAAASTSKTRPVKRAVARTTRSR